MRTTTLLLATLVVTASACGPIFQTRYTYTPPENSHGRACVYSCDTTRTNCEYLERQREENCEERARFERERCERDYELRGKKPKWYDCSYGGGCSADLEHCQVMYNSCYQSCGGRVRSDEVCVANCDKIKK